MRMYDVIEKKKRGFLLTKQEMYDVINGDTRLSDVSSFDGNLLYGNDR